MDRWGFFIIFSLEEGFDVLFYRRIRSRPNLIAVPATAVIVGRACQKAM
jgi:hypothetical protein